HGSRDIPPVPGHKKTRHRAGLKITLAGPGWDAICEDPEGLSPAPAFGALCSSCSYFSSHIDMYLMYYYHEYHELNLYHYYGH
ncbi:MAG: hypothetical protein V7720_08335, partial [Halioglobus sp.]